MRGRGFRWMNIYVTSNATPIHRISETNTCAWKIKNWETAPLQWYFFQEVYGTFSSAPGRIVSPVLEDCSFTGYTVWYSPFECFKRSFWSSLIPIFSSPAHQLRTPHTWGCCLWAILGETYIPSHRFSVSILRVTCDILRLMTIKALEEGVCI